MSSENKQSRKKKSETMSFHRSTANFLCRQPLLSGSFHPDSLHPALSKPARISVRRKVRNPRQSCRSRHQSKREQSASSSRNASSQLVPVRRDSERQRGFRKSLARLPKLFSRFLRLGSNSDNESVATAESEVSTTSKSKTNRWTKFMSRNRSQPQKSEPSFVSYTHSSLYAGLGPSTQVDGAESNLNQPPPRPPKNFARPLDHEKAAGNIRKSFRSEPASKTSVTSGPPALPPPVYLKRKKFATEFQFRRSSRKLFQRRSKSAINSDAIERIAGHFKHQSPTRSTNKSSQKSNSDPFGDIPPISAPILEPNRGKQPSWRRIQKRILKRESRKFPEPISCEENVDQNSAESQVPAKLSQSESDPFGDVAFTSCPVLKPVYIGPTYTDSTPVANESHVEASSSHTFAQPQILESVQNEASTSGCLRLQQIKSSASSSDYKVDVKVCPESAKTSDLKMTHSGFSADSSSTVQSPSELVPESAGQVFTSTNPFKNLPEKKTLEIVPGTSTNVLRSHRHFTSCSSTSSSPASSTIFKNATEASVSLNNLLLSDSVTSGSMGSDAGNSSELRATSLEGQIEFAASSSSAADNLGDSQNENISSENSSLVRQKSIDRKKAQGKHQFFGKLRRAFSTADKNNYKVLDSKSEPPVTQKKKLFRKSKKKCETDPQS